MALATTGGKRLRLLLCGLSGGGCLLMMAAVLVFYGRPYNPLWWWVMGAILLAAIVLPLALASAIEWVMRGYSDARGN